MMFKFVACVILAVAAVQSTDALNMRASASKIQVRENALHVSISHHYQAWQRLSTCFALKETKGAFEPTLIGTHRENTHV